MSEKMKQLFEKLAQNPELKAELEKNPPKSAEDVIAVAARLGVELKKEELEAGAKELSLDGADQLDGGISLYKPILICGSASNALAGESQFGCFFTNSGLAPFPI